MAEGRISGPMAVVIAALIGIVPFVIVRWWPTDDPPSPKAAPSPVIMTGGLPDGISLARACEKIGGRLNVSIVFATKCTKAARNTPLYGAQIEGDTAYPAAIINDLLTRVRDNTVQYKVLELEPRKRYEIQCY